MAELVPLDDLETLRTLLDQYPHLRISPRGEATDAQLEAVEEKRRTWSFRGDSFCNKCGRRSRMRIRGLNSELPTVPPPPVSPLKTPLLDWANEITPEEMDEYEREVRERYVPMALRLSCVQCESDQIELIHESPSGKDVVLLPSTGVAQSKDVPLGVGYYLDQASRANAMGAHSAAVGMYRVAMEHMLHDQGYTIGMLKQQTTALEADIANGTGKPWTKQIDVEYIDHIRELGNHVLHTNAGDIGQQSSIDAELVRIIAVVFADMLDTIYEEPARVAQKKAVLAAARGK